MPWTFYPSSILIKHNPYSEEKDIPLKDMHLTFRRLVEKLLYWTITRPDIAYVVSFLNPLLSKPLVLHFQARIKILKYIKNAPGKRILYKRDASITLAVIIGHRMTDFWWRKFTINCFRSPWKDLGRQADLIIFRWRFFNGGFPPS